MVDNRSSNSRPERTNADLGAYARRLCNALKVRVSSPSGPVEPTDDRANAQLNGLSRPFAPVDIDGGRSLGCQKRDCGPVAAFVFLFVSRGATGGGRSGQCKNSWLSSPWVACRLGLGLFRRLSRCAKERARWDRRLQIESCADPVAGALFVLFAEGSVALPSRPRAIAARLAFAAGQRAGIASARTDRPDSSVSSRGTPHDPEGDAESWRPSRLMTTSRGSPRTTGRSARRRRPARTMARVWRDRQASS